MFKYTFYHAENIESLFERILDNGIFTKVTDDLTQFKSHCKSIANQTALQCCINCKNKPENKDILILEDEHNSNSKAPTIDEKQMIMEEKLKAMGAVKVLPPFLPSSMSHSATKTLDSINSSPAPITIGQMIMKKNGIQLGIQSCNAAYNDGDTKGSIGRYNSEIEIIDSDCVVINDKETCNEINKGHNEKANTEDVTVINACSTKTGDDSMLERNERKSVSRDVPHDDELQELYAHIPSLQPRPARREIEFVSLDAKENEDNIDVRWDELKKLKTDSELQMYSRAAFGNREISDPNRCLSFQGFKRKEESRGAGLKRKFNPTNHPEIKIENGRIVNYNRIDYESTTSDGKRKAMNCPEEMRPAKRQKLITFDIYEKGMRYEIQKSFTQRIVDNKYWKYKVRHFKKSIEETKSFLKMYSNQSEKMDNKLYMSEKELITNCNIELIFRQFYQYYGANEIRNCPDCSNMDKEDILHPY